MKRSRTSSTGTLMAGPTMWKGGRWSCWAMNSPRSVSQTSIPFSSRTSLSAVSSVTMDLPLVTYLMPFSLASLMMKSLASLSSRIQTTFIPLAVAFFSNSSRSSGSRAMASARIAAPQAMAAGASGRVVNPASRFIRIIGGINLRKRRWRSFFNSFFADSVNCSVLISIFGLPAVGG